MIIYSIFFESTGLGMNVVEGAVGTFSGGGGGGGYVS